MCFNVTVTEPWDTDRAYKVVTEDLRSPVLGTRRYDVGYVVSSWRTAKYAKGSSATEGIHVFRNLEVAKANVQEVWNGKVVELEVSKDDFLGGAVNTDMMGSTFGSRSRPDRGDVAVYSKVKVLRVVE